MYNPFTPATPSPPVRSAIAQGKYLAQRHKENVARNPAPPCLRACASFVCRTSIHSGGTNRISHEKQRSISTTNSSPRGEIFNPRLSRSLGRKQRILRQRPRSLALVANNSSLFERLIKSQTPQTKQLTKQANDQPTPINSPQSPTARRRIRDPVRCPMDRAS